jgi:polysaccharide deacetylase 2 family uncharacterized protein YibQ
MRKHFSSFFNPKYLVVFLALLILISTSIGVGYFLGLQQISNSSKIMDESNNSFEYESETLPTKKTNNTDMLKKKEIKALEEEMRERKIPDIIRKSRSDLPKLVIIIDDVSYDYDVAAIHSIGLPLVMSFLPPVTRHPNSARLAQEVNGYMVHLPLEAIDFNDEEDQTLHVGDSIEKISQTIQKIKKWYPNVRYINNHTGSKFTSDKASMEKLLKVLDDEGITFVDSRTIGTTKAQEILKKNGKRYIHRDVFLDHQDGVANVKAQIREAVEIAKKNGSAIAIGHPRPDTITALKQSKELLKQVQLVGIDKI